MGKLPVCKGKEAVKAFEKEGWHVARYVDDHFILKKEGERFLFSIPDHDPLKKGTLRRLIRDAGLSVDEFIELTKLGWLSPWDEKDVWKRYSDEGFKHYQVIYPGFKYNMMDLQASLGIHQMKRIDKYLNRREQIWEMYDNAFADLPVFTPPPPEPDTVHARHLYTLLIDSDRIQMTRDEAQQRLYEMNIGTGIHFISLHLHEYYRKTFGFQPNDFANAKFISDRTISLPLSAKLTDQDVGDVIDAVRAVMRTR